MSEGYDQLDFLHVKEQRNSSSEIVAVVAGLPDFAVSKFLLLFFLHGSFQSLLSFIFYSIPILYILAMP